MSDFSGQHLKEVLRQSLDVKIEKVQTRPGRMDMTGIWGFGSREHKDAGDFRSFYDIETIFDLELIECCYKVWMGRK
jgi:hypothetical protein